MRNMTKAGGKQGGGCEAEVGDWGKSWRRKKKQRKEKKSQNCEKKQ